MTATIYRASSKQEQFIISLRRQIILHHIDQAKANNHLVALANAEKELANVGQVETFASFAQASHLINELKLAVHLNKTTKQAQANSKTVVDDNGVFVSEAVTEGAYRIGEDVFNVKESKTSGRLYAQVWDAIDKCWVYAPGVIFNLSASDKMSLEECKAFGIENVRCCVCARKLTAAASKAAGIGPICSGKF